MGHGNPWIIHWVEDPAHELSVCGTYREAPSETGKRLYITPKLCDEKVTCGLCKRTHVWRNAKAVAEVVESLA